MKKLLLGLILLFSLNLISCKNSSNPGVIVGISPTIQSTKHLKVYRDIYTDVMYYKLPFYYGYGLTPIVKNDGTYLTYSEWLNKTSEEVK